LRVKKGKFREWRKALEEGKLREEKEKGENFAKKGPLIQKGGNIQKGQIIEEKRGGPLKGEETLEKGDIYREKKATK